MRKIKWITFAVFSLTAASYAVRVTTTVNQTVDTRDYVVSISSPFGTTYPPQGVHTNSWHSTVYSYVVESPIYEPGGLTLHSRSGFSGSGISPDSGSGTYAWVVQTHVNSTLNWDWQTLHWITWAVTGQGAVQPINMAYSGDGAWCTEGESHHLRANPDYGWLFTGWSGGASGGPEAADLYFTPTGPTNLLAAFSDDPDGDGLKNTNEWAVGADPWISDTDGDGFADLFEFNNGLSPTRDSSAFLAHIENNPETYGLYTSNALLDVSVGELAFSVFNGEATLDLQLEASDDLVTWTNAGPAQIWTWPVDSAKRFFRVRSSR